MSTITPGIYTLKDQETGFWLNASTFGLENTLHIDGGSGGDKWTITKLHDTEFYQTYKASDKSYACPAPIPSVINLHHRTDAAGANYPWTIAPSGTGYKVVDPVTTRAFAIVDTTGIQLNTADTEGLVFDFVLQQ